MFDFLLCLLRQTLVLTGVPQMYARRVSFGFGSWVMFVARWTSSLLFKTLVHAFVTSHVDYCNSVLSSAPKKVTDKLQHVQNAAARLVTGTWKYERGLSRLMHDDLHWLVIPQCSTSLPWQSVHSIVVFSTDRFKVSRRLLCAGKSLKLLIANTCDLPDVINCQIR